MMNRSVNLITLSSSIILAGLISIYLFTPVMDEWVLEKSLKRFCGTQKEQFNGEFYSPAYLCTFIEGVK